jgi:hypothetical protein
LTADIVAARGRVAGVAAHGAAQAATVAVDLCVEVTALQASSELGQPAQWSVSAWATGGNVADAAIGLQATPAGSGTPQFSFGCGSSDGASACSLGTVDASSLPRQLQVQLTVPFTATATAVSLTATGSATGLDTDPAASAPVTLLASAAPIGAATLPVLPGATDPSSATSPAGSAAGLFPTLNPSATPTAIAAGSRPVASTSALSSGNTHVGAELAGLVALAAACVLAVTRVSIRRPGGAGQAAATGAGPQPPAPGGPPSGEAGGEEPASVPGA